MTVSAQETIFRHVGNGVTTVFAYSCQVLQPNDLYVYVDGAAVTSGITKNGIGSLTGGTVTFSVAPANGAAIILEREVTLERTTDYQQNGDFLSRVVNPDFNRLWMAMQQQSTNLGRALVFPKTDISAANELPAAAVRADMLLSFNSSGQPIAVAAAAQSATALSISLAANGGTSQIGTLLPGAGVVPRTLTEELSQRKVSFFRWLTPAQIADVQTKTWYTGDVAAKRLAMYNSIVAAETFMRLFGVSLEFPEGHYEFGDINLPFRNAGAGLLDYRGSALFCSPGVTFASVSPDGADLFQLNAIKNFAIFGFPRITGQLTTLLGSGTNGVSITGGWDGIYLEIEGYNLPSVDAGAFVDGGKALTVQPGTTVNPCGSLRARVRATGCSFGFSSDIDLTTMAAKNTSVDIEVVAEDCFIGMSFSALAATAALAVGMSLNYRIRGIFNNCQRDVSIGRGHGIDVDARVKSTKTAAALRLNPLGVAWRAADTIVEAMVCTYAKNSNINVSGYKFDCDYKARIGGSAPGASGLNGATEFNKIKLDIGGVASIGNVVAINSFGNTARANDIEITSVTATTIDALLLTPANQNVIKINGVYKGTFTATLTGVTTVVTGSVTYSVNGNQVSLTFPALSGTSNTTSCLITGLPADIWPAVSQFPNLLVTDNSVTAAGRAVVGLAGSITLNFGVSSAFTAAGTKGIPETTITYQRF